MDIIFFTVFIFSLGYVLNLILKIPRNYLWTICVSAVKDDNDVFLGCGVEFIKPRIPMRILSWYKRRKFISKFRVEDYDEIFYDANYHSVEDGEWVIE